MRNKSESIVYPLQKESALLSRVVREVAYTCDNNSENIFVTNWATMSFPRFSARAVSDCQIRIAIVFIPFPL